MPVNVTALPLSNNRSPRAYGGTRQGFAFTRSYTTINLFQDNSLRSGGGGVMTSMSSASLAQGAVSKPLNKSPSSSYIKEMPRNRGISRPTSLLFEQSIPAIKTTTSKVTTPTKPLYSPCAGNTRSLVNALNSLSKGDNCSDSQVILGKNTKFTDDSKKRDLLYVPRHGGVSSYAKAYLDKTKQTHVEWHGRPNKPREIDTRDINLNKDKPPTHVSKPGAQYGAPYRDNSITRNRSVVRITSRRKKSVKDIAPKTIGQKLMEKYVERDKDEKKPDPTEYIPRNNRFANISNSIPLSDKLPVDLNISGPNTNLPLLQSSQSFDNPKQLRGVAMNHPVVHTSSSSDSDSDEQDDTVIRLHRATETAANKKNLEGAQDVKDAIIAAILHPDIDIESDEEMQNLIADGSRSSSNSSKGSENKSIKRKSRKISKNKTENIVGTVVEQNNNAINTKDTGGKAEGEAIVCQLKRFVKQQLSMKKASYYSKPKKHPSETDNESREGQSNQHNETKSKILDSKNNNTVSRNSCEKTNLTYIQIKQSAEIQTQTLVNNNYLTSTNQKNASCERNVNIITTGQLPAMLEPSLGQDDKYSLQENSDQPVSLKTEAEKSIDAYIDICDIPQITLKSPVNNESYKNNKPQLVPYDVLVDINPEQRINNDNFGNYTVPEKQHEQYQEISNRDLTRNIIESETSAILAVTSGKHAEGAKELSLIAIQNGGKNCGVAWGELAPGAPDIPVEPEWPPKNKAQQVPVKMNDKLVNGTGHINTKSPVTKTEKSMNGEKKAMKRPRQIVPAPRKEDKCIANILEARKILKRPVKIKQTEKDATEDATDIAYMGKKVLKKPIPAKDDTAISLENQLKVMKNVLKAPTLAEERQKKLVKKTAIKNNRSSSSSSEASITKKNDGDKLKKGKGRCKKSPSGDKSNNEVGMSLQVMGSKETMSQSADSGYGSSPSTPQPLAGQTDVKDEKEICNMCGTNCHKKCEKQMPNLCGVNQKLLAEALSSVKKGSGGGQDSGITPVPGSLSEENDDDTETESDTAEYFGSPEIRSPLQSRPKFKNYSLDDFNFVKVLGKGSYGKVMLAEQKGTENYFAIKCLKKDVVLEDNDVECTLIERKVLTLGTKHPYLCHLFCSFQTPSHLFFVMEYLTGGDLMFHIQHCGRFDEYRACFYAAEITSGLKFLHNKGIIYRDLKLDNILLDYQGHIRIADFGMCKLQIYLDRYADTFCGTPDYMAPEVIKGQHYNQCVDWWSFGVLLYEMLTGKSPFKGCDEDHLFWLICHDEPFYPKFLSREATEILKQLLDKDNNRRLGVPFSPYGEIKDNPFFHYIDWQKIERKEVETPYKPRLRHILDVQYFDPLFTKRNAAITPLDESILATMDQTAFKEFSYTNPNITD